MTVVAMCCDVRDANERGAQNLRARALGEWSCMLACAFLFDTFMIKIINKLFVWDVNTHI